MELRRDEVEPFEPSGERVAAPLTLRRIVFSDALIELVRAGRGVGLVDRWTVASRLGRDVRALRLAPAASRMFYAVWRRGHPRELAIPQLLDVIKRAGTRAVAKR